MVSLKITHKSTELQKALKQHKELVSNPAAILKNVGEALHNATIDRMRRERAPDGSPWAPLNPLYASSKRGSKILQEAGMRNGLMGSLNYQVMLDRLEYGTNKVYAHIHQEGGTIKPTSADRLSFRMGGKFFQAKSVTIPARPYLGIGINEERAIDNAVHDYIKSVFR
ncbi:MAG: phage virion morphogenesis protein [Alphaproteobacteria bacterium]|nr:phage virion morphogenesis protein [Alphaproteobacteria bacterium]MDD9919771.1 phage virion morphogenesis protein [Alphaproteobacteria bacterium]